MSASAAGGATEFEDALTKHSLVIRDRIQSEDDAFQPKSEENTLLHLHLDAGSCWMLHCQIKILERFSCQFNTNGSGNR